MKNFKKAISQYHRLKENKTKDKHMDGFQKVFRELLPAEYVLHKDKGIQETPYRNKRWDYSVWNKSHLVGVIELKSLHKSANKNINNRQEEAIGCATFLKEHRPSVKRSYFWIGDALDESTQIKWESFLHDCLNKKWYDSVCALVLDGDGNYQTFNEMSIVDMFSVYNVEQQ
jgi:hypothetical protein